jgi:murein lipoprotein
MLIKITKIFALALAIGLTGGCADMTQMNALKATADAALAEAQSASAVARNALTVAGDANVTALSAQKTATAALECCTDNTARLDRMFEKAMMK